MNPLSMFKSSTGNWDISRVITFKLSTVFAASLAYAVFHLHAVPTWTDVGGAMAALMAGGGAFIGGKEIAIAKANATNPGGGA